MELTVARVAGALAVMTSPSAALLLFCAAGQMLHGNVWAPLQAIVLFAGVVLPAAFVAAALSALAGSLLPRIVARIVSVAACGGASGRGRGRRPQALVPPSLTSLRSA